MMRSSGYRPQGTMTRSPAAVAGSSRTAWIVPPGGTTFGAGPPTVTVTPETLDFPLSPRFTTSCPMTGATLVTLSVMMSGPHETICCGRPAIVTPAPLLQAPPVMTGHGPKP